MFSLSYRCPVCGGTLAFCENGFRCPQNHTFDLSREGYLNLALGKSESGDDKEMSQSRHRFLAEEYYHPFADALAGAVQKYTPSLSALIDCGSGEGYYLRVLRESFPQASLFGVDLSKNAVKTAAKCEKGKENPCRYAVCSLFALPLFDGIADAAISVFAPIAEEETARVLKNGGFFFVAGPGPRHLSGLKKALYDTPYDNPEKHREYKGFRKIDEITCDYAVTVHGGAIRDLFAMTPYYWKTSKSDGKKLQGLERLETELSFRIGVYRKA